MPTSTPKIKHIRAEEKTIISTLVIGKWSHYDNTGLNYLPPRYICVRVRESSDLKHPGWNTGRSLQTVAIHNPIRSARNTYFTTARVNEVESLFFNSTSILSTDGINHGKIERKNRIHDNTRSNGLPE
jgi:hypothetical protein